MTRRVTTTLTKRIQMMIWICNCTIRPPPGCHAPQEAAPDWLIFGAIVNTERNESVHVCGRRRCSWFCDSSLECGFRFFFLRSFAAHAWSPPFKLEGLFLSVGLTRCTQYLLPNDAAEPSLTPAEFAEVVAGPCRQKSEIWTEEKCDEIGEMFIKIFFSITHRSGINQPSWSQTITGRYPLFALGHPLHG